MARGQDIEPNGNTLLLNTFRRTKNVNLGRPFVRQTLLCSHQSTSATINLESSYALSRSLIVRQSTANLSAGSGVSRRTPTRRSVVAEPSHPSPSNFPRKEAKDAIFQSFQ